MTRFALLLPALAAAALACGERPGAADTAAGDSPAAATPAAGATTSAADASAMLDPDAATREQLATLPGMDSTLVTAVIGGRPYADMLAVDRVLATRLNAEQRRAVYARLWKPIDLNTAKGEEILLIPGVGNRMKHEFEEYRPYRSMEQFRREIGKYVDESEIARLEKYVTIK